MKVRISHFQTKQIQINETTRPSVKTLRSEGSSFEKTLQRLAKANQSKGTKVVQRIGKAAKERKQFIDEAVYAALPEKEKSELVSYIIKVEAKRFRDASKRADQAICRARKRIRYVAQQTQEKEQSKPKHGL